MSANNKLVIARQPNVILTNTLLVSHIWLLKVAKECYWANYRNTESVKQECFNHRVKNKTRSGG